MPNQIVYGRDSGGSPHAILTDANGQIIFGGGTSALGTVAVSGTVNANITGGTTAITYAKGTGTNTQASVGTASTLMLAGNANRREALFVNAGNVTAYIGGSPATAGTSLYFPPGATLLDNRSTVAWHGITASGTADIRVYEVV